MKPNEKAHLAPATGSQMVETFSPPSIPPLLAAFMPTLIAVWAPLWTYFILSEDFSGALTVIGAVIVHFAVLVAALRRMKMGT